MSRAKGKARPDDTSHAMRAGQYPPFWLTTHTYKGHVLLTTRDGIVWLTPRQADRLAIALERCAEHQRRIDKWDHDSKPRKSRGK